MKHFSGILVAVLLMAQVACQQTNTNPDENKNINLDEKSAQLVKADNAFGLDIFREVRKASNKENIMISPLSISVALAMTYNGADGDTKTEMENALRLNGLTAEQINASYKMLINELQSVDKDVVFEIANAIYYTTGFTVKQPFLEVNKNSYDAEVSGIDFSLPSALEEINGWVKTKTHNKISKILDNLSPDARMVLLNAIYFNGIWTNEFDKDGTKMLSFRKGNGKTEDVAMMNMENTLEYTSNGLFDAVKLPYGNGQYNMIVMRPADGEKSGDVIDELSADNWGEWIKSFNTEEHVVVTMPRFKFAFDTGLKEVLKKMGMVKAFNSAQSDFSKINDDPNLYISKVIHKSFIDVNETGTEAAAVTAVVMETLSVGPGDGVKKIYFTVNKPFVFAITEKDTGAILFIGEVNNPEYEE
jgi:serpin B